MSESIWLRSYAARHDAEAFAQIVGRYESMVFATCRRKLHDAADVEDAVQETFLRLARKAGELRINLGGWLHSCAVNVATDLNRRRASRLRRETAAAKPEAAPTDAPDSRQLLAELRDQLDAALEKLDPDSRELIIQRFFVGRPQSELAAEANVASSTIAHRLEQAVEKLRRNLKVAGNKTTWMAAGGILIAALEAEKASAGVPHAVTINVMKIGLSGAGPAATAGPLAPIAVKTLAGIAAMAAVVIGLWLLFRKNPETIPQPARIAAAQAEVFPAPQASDPAALAKNQSPVTAELRVWSAEGVELPEITPRLLDSAGNEARPADEKGMGTHFRVLPGHYRAIVKRTDGQTETHEIDIGAKPLEAWQTDNINILLQ